MSCCALQTTNAFVVAYIETTPDLPIKATSPDYLSKHQNAAIRAIHDSLTQAKNEMTDDEICFAIVLLMIAAVSFA